MIQHPEINDQQLRSFIRQGIVTLAGNRKLKIYGMLNCKSGKRMKKQTRVFFRNEAEAIVNGFRPCGHCMRKPSGSLSKKQVETS